MGFERSSVPGCELVAEVAREFGEVRFRAIGFSMMPVILPGDVLTVARGQVAVDGVRFADSRTAAPLR